MQLSNKEQELLLTYQNWLKKNNLSGNCNAYFIEENSILVFQKWNLQQMISETLLKKIKFNSNFNFNYSYSNSFAF